MLVPAVCSFPLPSFYKDQSHQRYRADDNAGIGLSGGIIAVDATCKATEQPKGVGITVYHFVESIDETKKRVEELGGVAQSEKNKEGDNGWFMYFKDVEGNRFGIYEVRKETLGKPDE